MSQPEAPRPILAQWVAATLTATVTFSLALQPEAGLDRGNWFIRYDGFGYDLTSASSALDFVTLVHSAPPIVDPGPNVVSYSPPPYDVTGITGAPVLPFADFPLTVK